MSEKRNYLIGRAEGLTSPTPYRGGFSGTKDLYSFEENIERLNHALENTVTAIKNMNEMLCPRDYAVTKLTLHPSHISKSAFPKKILRGFGLQSIGSKPTKVKPDKWSRKGEPTISPTTSLYVTGKRESFNQLYLQLTNAETSEEYNSDLCAIWNVDVFSSEEKIKTIQDNDEINFEVGIQCLPNVSNDFIKRSFELLAHEHGFSLKHEYSIEVSNLWFIPIVGPSSNLSELANFSFTRVIRPTAKLRAFTPLIRNQPLEIKAELPNLPPVAHDVRVAILDGGLPPTHCISPWLQRYSHSDPQYADCEGGPEHGIGVTSAYLFGPLKAGEIANRPFTYVDHHRVLDKGSNQEDPFELYRTLTHIEDILISRQYEFINLSLGPELTIDDDEIHPWTSLIDSYLADGETFLTVAAGNNGSNSDEFGLNRIQVPSDCVNAITVGASDKQDEDWNRAYYSAVGPGRAPGRVKPDFCAFGGGPEQYFHVAGPGAELTLIPQLGTSFAAPYLLRSAAGIKALFGSNLTGLAIKSLMINSASNNEMDIKDVGWGSVPTDLSTLIESPDGVARIIYQGTLVPSKVLRIPLPLPINGIQGMVDISATCSISSNVDPQDTSMYTKAGVRISWFPKKGAKPETFFGQTKKANEARLRSDAGKWETVLNESRRKNGAILDNPCFEIHYMARDSGAEVSATKADIIQYAFVITLHAKKHKNLHNDILDAYPEVLSHIEPRVTADINITT